MSDFEKFFEEQDPDKATNEPLLPESAITTPLESMLPYEIIYPQTVKFAGVFAVDGSTNLLYINTLAEVSNKEKKLPQIDRNYLPLLKVATLDEGIVKEGYIVDGRNSSALTSVHKLDVESENERAETDYRLIGSSNRRFYTPALAVLIEAGNGKLAINGDQSMKDFGLGMILSVNEAIAASTSSYGAKPTGSYLIGTEAATGAKQGTRPENKDATTNKTFKTFWPYRKK